MSAGKSQLDRLRKRFEILLSGRAPSDPLYLTNRTWRQKLQAASMIALPVLLLIALVTIGATHLFQFRKADPDEHPPAEAPPAAAEPRPLPDPISASTDLEVVNIRIVRDARPPVVTGVVRNKTNQKFDSAEVSYYLADSAGSLVGAGTTVVANVEPHGSVTFRMPLKMANAEYVIARDAHPN